ncbi:MAG: IclR family transcriptional regulator [Reyranellaceae bacterium]
MRTSVRKTGAKRRKAATKTDPAANAQPASAKVARFDAFAGRDVEETRQDAGLLQRGFAMVEVLVKEERPLTSAEIAELVGLNSSTTHRLLQTLIQIGYVWRDQAKRYHPTARALFPTSLYHPLNGLRRAAADELRSLRQTFGFTTALQIFLGYKRVVLEIMLGSENFSPYFQTEVTAPIYATASGKLLLANLSEAERDQVLGEEPYKSHASRTLVTRAELERELTEAMERGYSLTLDEMLQGLAAVAAPIWLSPRRMMGAVVISGPSKHFDAQAIKQISTAAMRSAELFSFASPDIRAVSRFLGY